ncbi:hypothetical protein P872_17985 [Rhodonellum psychrophilum GCM71 = DSM 17998]|uniref:Sulfate ABC transporter permease n=2 Tax=Rhodonellum TaxID=336827 RepID=U5BXW6_9BACT|nr:MULTISPECIES: hypothetical protein [Rhodonellum]ERM82404.1 hypothetical protein P872_17985 [Rhodonellum psychrophilum GCM71 = DSM 17998]SDY88733.1 hypothetical protein SAMN05444412_103276 [Rhodonellum ikkaensis]
MVKVRSQIGQRIEESINFDKRIFFILLLLLFYAIRFLTNDVLVKSIPGYEQLQEDGSLSIFFIFNALNYLWTPFALLWKFTVIAFIIWIGAFSWGYKVSFKKLWQFVMVAEIVFIFPELIKLLFIMTTSGQLTTDEIKGYAPLSLYSWINPQEVATKFHYPLRTLNLFEILYWMLLILGFHSISNRSLKISTLVVLSSYGFGLLIWLVFYVMSYR